MTTPTPRQEDLRRRADLDWIRVCAFFLLILYHVGMFYVPWDWHVKTPHPVEALEPVMMLTNPWRLTLLFLVSGAATRFMADKLTPGVFTARRVLRLAPPLVFAMFVIVPPQSYYEIVEQVPQAVEPYGSFWLKYATASGNWCDADGCLITPTWNHMWFAAYLLVYTLVLGVLLPLSGGTLRPLGDKLDGMLKGPWLLVLPIVFLALIRVWLLPMFEITHALVDDWYNHALSFSAFLFGFLTAKSIRIRDGFIRWRWVALVLAVVSWAVFASYAWVYRADGATPPEALRTVMRFVYATDQWCFITAILGFGALQLTKGGPVLRYLTLAVFPFYIIHQTLIVVVAHNLAKLGLPQGLEGAILIAATFAGCFATYEIVRRVPVLDVLFGLRPEPRRKAEPAAALSG
ncbi:acyltransferase family protein [Caulobacter segnis]|uniref:acyltransferase family protein n=1 Tax=Caulobacter segnis TaxID=88688 RepID=UPI00240EB46D|nr:acyltransferase family protein [Caulobacter segnis]MDG2522851.1 acyltransferase family protein [Caulobacter segnis]